MFIRIYTSLLISIVLATLSCYGLYQLQYLQRYGAYANGIFRGSFELISLGLERHSGVKQQQWLKIVSKLMETELMLQINDRDAHQLSNRKSPIRITLDDHEYIQVSMVTDNNYRLTTRIDYIGEQHYRLMAILLLNELGRVPQAEQASLLGTLAKMSLPELALTPLSTLALDQQQLSRIKRGDVVVNERQDMPNTPRWVYARLPSSPYVLVIGPMDDFEEMPLSIIIFMLAISILITAAMAYFLVYGLEKRLAKIDASVQSFSEGQGHDPVPVQGQDAISRLAATINNMELRIGRLLNEQREIGQAVSHELRTPISRMKFRLHSLLDGQPTDKQLPKINGLQRDINEIDNLIDEILTLHQAEHPHEVTEVQINTMLTSLLELHALQHAGIQYELDAGNSPTIAYGDPHLLKRALQNLIQNGFKHARTTLQAKLSEDHGQLKMEIADDGEGIADNRKEQVFTPFIRLDSSRNKQTGGFGLGLAIVKRICDAHGIKVWVEDSPLGGAKFCLLFPETTSVRKEPVR